MSDQVDKGEELSDRFSTRSRPKEDPEDIESEDDVSDAQDTQDTDETDDLGDTGHTQDTDDQDDLDQTDTTDGGDTTRTRSQYAMYLPDALQEELDGLYDQYNGQSLIEGDGGIEKHKDFLEGVVRAGLDHPELDDYVGVQRDQ